jgi:hypothetical protein
LRLCFATPPAGIGAPHTDRHGSEEEEAALAHLIADAWRVRLRGLYPQRRFDVLVLPSSETGGALAVGFTELP